MFFWFRSASGGTAAGVLRSVTGAAVGAVALAGTAAGTSGHVTGAASGSVATVGTGAGTLGHVTGSAAGSVSTGGAGSGTLRSVTGSASGSVSVVGTGAGALGSVTGSGAGTIGSGAGSGTLHGVTGAASGSVSVVGVGAGTLRSVTGSASGSAGVSFGAGTLHGVTGAASGSVALTGTAAGTLSHVTGSGAASNGIDPLTFRESLAAALKADPAVAAVVGAKVFPLYLPESQSLPAVIYKVSTDRAEQNLSGHNGVNQADVLFIVEARRFSECETLGRAVFDLFHDLTGPIVANGVTVVEVQSESDTDGYDFPIDSTDRGTFATPLQYTFRYRKAKPVRPS